jgi:ActR/RegA family two-component response regulator
MASHALLLSNDPQSSLVLQRVLEEFDIRTEVCSSPRNARTLLNSRSFESVIVDADTVHDGLSVIGDLAENRINRGVVTVTLLRDAEQMKAAADVGATFMLHKPVPTEDARRIMRISRHMIARDSVRQYLRLALPNLAYALLDEAKQILVENISEGGMAIQAEEQMLPGVRCRVRFTLPGDKNQIVTEAQVMWSDASGRAGLRFHKLEPAMQQRLARWIEEQYASGVPDADGNCRVSLDIVADLAQSRPRRWMAFALLVDLLTATVGTLFFGLMVWVVSGEILSPPNALLVGLLFCGVYHYLFIAHGQRTLGNQLVDHWRK